MKGIASIFGLLLAASAVPAAAVDVCLDFQTPCEYLELTITGDLITGTWVNFDCEGHNAGPLWGVIRDGLPLACDPGRTTGGGGGAQNPAKAGIVCLWDWGCEVSPEWDQYFFLDGLDGSLDTGFDIDEFIGPPGTCGIDDLRYEVLLGPCPAGPKRGGVGMTIMQQALQKVEQQ